MKIRLISAALAGLLGVSLDSVASAQDPGALAGSSGGAIAVSASSGPSSFSRSFKGGAPQGVADASRASKASLSPAELRRTLQAKPMKAPLGGESIILPDTRKEVAKTKKYPYRAVVRILFDAGGGDALCTGWLISPDTVATAGHCVAPGDNTGFYDPDTYVLAPGANGSATPYGTCGAEAIYAPNGWRINGLDDYDYGIIKLDCDIGSTTGWFGFFWTPDSLNGIKQRIPGYPGDKPLTQWFSNGKVTVSEVRRIFYKNDTIGGMSGSPVYYDRSAECSPCSMAIHAYGLYGSPPFSTNNHGTRITEEVFNNLNTVIAFP